MNAVVTITHELVTDIWQVRTMAPQWQVFNACNMCFGVTPEWNEDAHCYMVWGEKHANLDVFRRLMHSCQIAIIESETYCGLVVSVK